MTRRKREVKPLYERVLDWIDGNPRTGWYLFLFTCANLLLNLIDAFDLF